MKNWVIMAKLMENDGKATFPETCLTPEGDKMYWFLFYIVLVSNGVQL